MLNKLKLLLGIPNNDTSKDNLLNLIISQVYTETKSYTHLDNIYPLEDVMLSMCEYRYNRIGSIGLNSESYTGINFNYDNKYPENIYEQLRSYRQYRRIE